ncbi:MAG: universal stress protein [Pirellulales bacterium]|nr:universal stress protein [Pirellulales bacterium]
MNWLPHKNVLVPFDFSDDSRAALATALQLADDPAKLHVVHVLAIMEVTDPGVIWETIDDRSRRQHAEQAVRQELRRQGVDDQAQVVVRFGDPGHEIVDFAKDIDAGLIVVSSHGRTGLRHLLLGSVAERVVRLAQCPVLVLKHQKT